MNRSSLLERQKKHLNRGRQVLKENSFSRTACNTLLVIILSYREFQPTLMAVTLHGQHILSFMDDFNIYNQMKMHMEDTQRCQL